jgi:hypothetical protein
MRLYKYHIHFPDFFTYQNEVLAETEDQARGKAVEDLLRLKMAAEQATITSLERVFNPARLEEWTGRTFTFASSGIKVRIARIDMSTEKAYLLDADDNEKEYSLDNLISLWRCGLGTLS